MRKRIVGSMATTAAVFGALIGFAGPAASAQEPTAADAPAAPAWVMPGVKGDILQRAVRTVYSVTGTTDIDLRITNRLSPQPVINQNNWEVCAQAPAEGKPINPKNKRVTLYVRRPNTKGC